MEGIDKFGIKFRTASGAKEMECVYRLTHDMYVQKQYIEPRPDRRLVHYPQLDGIAETAVFVAENIAGEIIGTCSLTVDGLRGLPGQEDFPELFAAVRQECAVRCIRLGACWRLATAPAYHASLEVMMPLIAMSVETGKDLGIGTMLFSVTPKHASFYQRMLDLDILGHSVSAHVVKNTEAVLLRGDRARMLARWERVKTRRISARLSAVAAA